jgi:glycosyltransferase involved in cell wall biosynthesis/2-polyprenyl-3-methyl-5-hydroxy-6-metoxy-1,4-benzoquinol methylase
MNSPSKDLHPVKTCHVCKGMRVYYLFSVGGHRVVRCEDCGLVFLNPQPCDDELARIHGVDNFSGGTSEPGLKQAATGSYFSEIRRYHGLETGRLLEIGCGKGDFLVSAEADGWHVTGIEFSPDACKMAQQRLKNGKVSCGELQQAGLASDQFDLCAVSDVIEHVRLPFDFLQEIHRVLKPGGTLLIATPSIDFWSLRFMRQRQVEFKAGRLTYFDRQTIQTALFKTGFREIIVQAGSESPDVASGTMIFSRKAELRAQPLLSVIVPAYNEAKTFGTLMEALLRKELTGLQTEIIVVESNSTDGTREVALKYQGHPKVKLVLEEQPRGKGHAVRTGFKAASGDYVLIQDADLEYDLEDYDALLEHLVAGRSAFVLGARHGGGNVLKMRQFTGQLGLSLFLNLGHWFFATLINVLFSQRLRDPFTMFKVFRRDCLCGLEFECNRFDFDFELLIKLIRKGYRPVELPVNYRSRSFKEGKKVRMFRDPFSWLRALARLRWMKIDPMNVMGQKHKTGTESCLVKPVAPKP